MQVEKILVEKYIYKRIFPEGLIRIGLPDTRFRLAALVCKNVFKENRDREYIIETFNNYLAGLGFVSRCYEATIYKMAIALIEIRHDHRPEILNILKLEGITLKQWCKYIGVKYDLCWYKPKFATIYKYWIEGYHFAQKQARKRTHPDC